MGTLPGSIHRALAREWCAAFYTRKSEIRRTLLIVSLFLLSTLNSTVIRQTPAGLTILEFGSWVRPSPVNEWHTVVGAVLNTPQPALLDDPLVYGSNTFPLHYTIVFER